MSISAINLLSYYEQGYQFVIQMKHYAESYMRDWLGPGPQNFLLLPNGDVIPTSMQRSFKQDEYTLLYDAETHQISTLLSTPTQERPKRLSWLTVEHRCGETVTDLSDWIANVRIHNNQEPPLQQLVRLGGLVLNYHLAEDGDVTIHAIQRNGEESKWNYVGNKELKQENE